jgi:hypothetical protein
LQAALSSEFEGITLALSACHDLAWRHLRTHHRFKTMISNLLKIVS